VKIVAVVPAKNPLQSKSRLAGTLSPEERAALTQSMLAHVIGTLGESGVVDKIALITPDPRLLAVPPHVTVLEQPRPGLNPGLEQSREWALEQEADALLVVFADLPLLGREDIAQVAELGRERGTVVLAPDRHGTGTNVMLAHPPSLARFAFGKESFPLHLALHREVGARIEVYASRGTALDVDTPDDLLCLEKERLASAPR
jgi:2-phospho-L-lactate guanylyltransferase